MSVTLSQIVLALVVIFSIIQLTKWFRKRKRLVQAIEKLPGPPCVVPIVNHGLIFIYLDFLKHKWGTYTLTYHLMSNVHKLFPEEGIARFWLGLKPVVLVYSPENVETILSSTTVINKADEYRVFMPWIGEGLLTSRRNKWRFRRKILTPAFHFRILNDFLPTMNEEATKLIRKMNSSRYVESEEGFDITPVITMCTLDTLCETAMGVNMNCQNDEQSEYVKGLYELTEIALERVIRPWLWPDWIFYRTESGQKFNKAKIVMHEFSTRVILERKVEWEKQLNQNDDLKRLIERKTTTTNRQKDKSASSNKYQEDRVTLDDLRASSFFAKGNKRFAFLDLLLYQHLIENTMSLTDVREEVDTFMFAGHDTTAMSLSWTFYMLGLHKDIQARARKELDRILGGDDEFEMCTIDGEQKLADRIRVTNLTNEHLREMKYLDRVIKESLRLWPSVPFVGRSVDEDIQVGGKYIVPKGSTCMVFTHVLHNNPKYYPKPEVFDPDRFLPENSVGRHPFAYIPFSAGPRNCIGQKFAQMELKVILAKVLRNFYIDTVDTRDKLAVAGEMVLRSRNGLNIRITPRVD